jgi:DNA-binding NarL/FixJ family response regulator
VAAGKLPELTEREADVLRLVAQGLSNGDIAERLFIGTVTVKTYVSRLLTKLDATTRVHLAIHAYESGLVTPGDERRS